MRRLGLASNEHAVLAPLILAEIFPSTGSFMKAFALLGTACFAVALASAGWGNLWQQPVPSSARDCN
jgi:hypothetical protein